MITNNKILSVPFLTSLFIKQNEHHSHAVLLHTLKVVYNCIKHKQYRMVPCAIMHDFGKPVVANQDKQVDKDNDLYSFKHHEEVSYQIIKDWKFVSEYSKNMMKN